MNHSHKPGEECPICDGVSMDEFLTKTLATIRERGHAVLGIADARPSFSYTVGLTEAKLPELIIFGLHPRTAQGILNDLAAMMRKRERSFDDGELIRFEGATIPVKAIAVPQSVSPCNVARNLYGEGIQVMQVLVPDKAGRFPPKCAKPYNQQPVLR